MNYKKILSLIILVLAISITIVFFLQRGEGSKETPSLAQQGEILSASPEPIKTDFGTKIPKDFPTNTPVEEGVSVKQSYDLNYSGQRQLTIVFLSAKTAKENYQLYTEFLKKQNWNIANKYETTRLFSLYGTKEMNDMNVTINNVNSTITRSEVSISILKK